MGASAAWIKSMNLQCDQVWHELCTKKSKSFSSIFHFQTPLEPRKGLLPLFVASYTRSLWFR